MSVGIRARARRGGRLRTMTTTRKSSSAVPGDRRVRRTQATLQRALIDLVQERDLSQITVADVADRADVSRSTFYHHYQDVHELAEAACTSMLDDMFGYVLALDTARPRPADADRRLARLPARRARSVRRRRTARRGRRLAAARMPANAPRDDHPDQAAPDRPAPRHRHA